MAWLELPGSIFTTLKHYHLKGTKLVLPMLDYFHMKVHVKSLQFLSTRHTLPLQNLVNNDVMIIFRSVYSIDLPGFGLSDRCKLGKTPTQVENNWTDSIDQWRQKMNLDKIILIGHSMGGYLAAVYLMRYPQERFSFHEM